MGDPAFRVVDSASSGARLALVQYFDELASRFPEGFDTTAALSDATDAYTPPRGRFVLGGGPDNPDACGAVSFLDSERAEIKRMWVSPAARGKGLATRLLAYIEDLSLQAGRAVIVLDTNRVLSEAVALYERRGYLPIERYNDNPHAHHWFEKRLDRVRGG